MRLRTRTNLALLAVGLVALLPAPAAATTAGSVSVVAAGLDNPRGLDMMDGLAIVAESGHGGNTSQVSSINTATGQHTTVAGGLFSALVPPENDAVGVSGVSVRNGRIYAIFGSLPQETGSAKAGTLVNINPATGSVHTIASVGAFDYDYTAGIPNQEHDANPNAVLAVDGGFLVADAGSNTLTFVNRGGQQMKVVHYFPAQQPGFPHDEVPTCVAATTEALWVGTLAGRLYRMDGSGATAVVPTGANGMPLLTHVTGCVGSGDTLYLVNMFGAGIPFTPPPASSFFRGSVVRYDTGSGRASELANSFASPALSLPYAPAVGPDGNLYVTAGAICSAGGAGPRGCAGGGRLVRITLPAADE